MDQFLADEFARAARRSDGQSARAPRAPVTSIKMGKVSGVNPYYNTVQLTASSGKLLDDIRVIHPVTPDTPLTNGEWAAVVDLGLGGMFVFGRHVYLGTPAAVLL